MTDVTGKMLQEALKILSRRNKDTIRAPDRIDKVLLLIERIWNKYPDLRLSQLILNVSKEGEDIYNLEDDELYKRLREVYDQVR